MLPLTVCLVLPVAPTATESPQVLISRQLAQACQWPDTARDGLVEAIRQRHGSGVAAILIYGSYLRGKRDTLLDFYVLLDGYGALKPAWHAGLAWLLSPNVYQVRCGQGEQQARAKYAVMTLGRFEYAMRHDFHSYFWARFTQPCGLLYCRDDVVRERLVSALGQAADTFARRVLAQLPGRFSAADWVSRGLSLTYGCELRSEPPGHALALFDHNADYYRALLRGLATDIPGLVADDSTLEYRYTASAWQRRRSSLGWMLRRAQGKVLSVLRLLKAGFTFDRGFDYLLWKIARHSGVRVELTARQRKYPLIFGWPVLWRLYRRGAFR